jgi:hypothetical protein
VYRGTVGGKVPGVSAVCEQVEWDAMERERPGLHVLVRAGIASEGEAERLARAGLRRRGGPLALRPAAQGPMSGRAGRPTHRHQISSPFDGGARA